MKCVPINSQRGGSVGPCQSGKVGQTLPTPDCRLDKVCRSFRKQRRGAAVVEFAIVAPVFFLFVLGIIEYGRMVMVYQMITNASRMGARIAVLEDATEIQVTNQVTTFLSDSGISGATITPWAKDQVTGASKSFADLTNGDPVGVTISVDFDQVSWLPSPMFLGGKSLSASTQMRREGGG